MKIFRKERLENGRRYIYFCGIKVFSYKKHKHYKNNKIILVENGREKIVKRGISGLKIYFNGNNNIVKIELPFYAVNSKIIIDNNDVSIDIGSSKNFLNVDILCSNGNAQVLKIGHGTTIYGAAFKLAENSKIFIGEDCMFSNSISIWASDGHSVLDKDTKEILNNAGTVFIGNHVWVGESVKITKKTKIHDNCIVGIGSVCTKDYKEENVCIVGNPAKIVKRNINWNRINPYSLQEHRKYLINSIKHIDKKQYDFEISHFNESGVNKKTRKPKIIVSMTSFPQRMKDIHYAIYSLLKQTVKPDKIILWLGEDKFLNKEKDLPETLLNLCKYGLTIKWCKDIRSYTKLIPALKKFPDDIIITVDDDIYYPDYLVEKLYNAYLKNKNLIHCLRAHEIAIKKHKILPYNTWCKCVQNKQPSYKNFLTGVGGVLYPPHCLYKDVTNESLFVKMSPYADDVWFWAMAVKNKTMINIVNSDNTLIYINPERELRLTNEMTLAKTNVADNRNDEQLRNVINYFRITF